MLCYSTCYCLEVQVVMWFSARDRNTEYLSKNGCTGTGCLCFNDTLILWTGHLCSWCLLYLPGSSVVRGAGSCGLLQAQAGPSHREAAQEDAHEVEGDGWQVSCTAGHTATHFKTGSSSWLCEMMGVISCSRVFLHAHIVFSFCLEPHPNLECFQGWGIHSCCRQPVPVPRHSPRTKFHPYI